MSYISTQKAPNYTQEQLDTAIELASKGEPLRIIIDAILTSEIGFWVYRQQHPDYQVAFEQARQEGLEHLADGLMTAHDDITDVQRARLKSDNAKWLLSKRKPAIYGDKVDIHVTQTIDISTALNEARARVPSLRPNAADQAIDVTPTSISPTKAK